MEVRFAVLEHQIVDVCRFLAHFHFGRCIVERESRLLRHIQMLHGGPDISAVDVQVADADVGDEVKVVEVDVAAFRALEGAVVHQLHRVPEVLDVQSAGVEDVAPVVFVLAAALDAEHPFHVGGGLPAVPAGLGDKVELAVLERGTFQIEGSSVQQPLCGELGRQEAYFCQCVCAAAGQGIVVQQDHVLEDDCIERLYGHFIEGEGSVDVFRELLDGLAGQCALHFRMLYGYHQAQDNQQNDAQDYARYAQRFFHPNCNAVIYSLQK